ncbi:MAG: hypothetical protein RIR62_3090 [Pseudomonadota bacterium]|jgi:flagellar hook-associated protein 1 FlgK
MSLSSTLSSALSGLTVSSRRAEVVSTNIANAGTAGYVRRELAVSSRLVGMTGQGAQVDGVTRLADRVLIGDRRIAGAAAGGAGVLADYARRMEAAFGAPGSGSSLTDRIAALESALIAAAGQPSSAARLTQVLRAAEGLAATFNRAAASVQEARQAADTRIAAEVAELNTALGQVHDLNVSITAQGSAGGDVAALLDRRQAVIDRIAAIVPLREVARDMGKVALYTTGGAVLLEAGPATIGFDPTRVITADMTALPGLTLDGQTVRTGTGAPMGGGTLGALFAVRDAMAPTAQARLDALSRDLADRVAAVDAGAGGLFTDAGAPVTAARETGLAARLAVNPAADPDRGGALWRLRDGLSATTPGPGGDGARLSALAEALSSLRPPASPAVAGDPGARSLSGLAGEFLSASAAERLSAEADATHHAARSDALVKMELDQGVDTDAELQDLLLIEQAWAANARVIKTVDDLIRILMGF